MRSREYTEPWKFKRNVKLVRATRTQQFRVQDMEFWKNGKILSRHETLNKLLGADSAVLKNPNIKRKNGTNLTP